MPLITASLTAASSQMLANNERLESYGDSLITLLVILELCLTRDQSHVENDLDSARKSRTSNDLLMLTNLSLGIYEHMMVEPQTQQQSSSSAMLDGGNNGAQNIIKVMTPGGLGGNKFKNKIKKMKELGVKQRVWQFKMLKYRN